MIKNYIKNACKSITVIFIIIISVLAYLKEGVNYSPAEEVDVPSAIGVDIIRNNSEILKYIVPIVYYNYNTEPNITSYVLIGEGKDLSNTRETRQLKQPKKFVLGLEKIFVASESYAELGIESWMNILFNNPNRNNKGYFVVCNGNSYDLLNLKIPGYPGSPDYIDGIIKHSVNQNFFSNEYEIADVLINLCTEGKNIVVPYIDIKDKVPSISGMALFNEYKMVRKIDINEAKYMNLLRENDVNGMLSIYKAQDKYIDIEVKSKRNVSVSNIHNKLHFTINLNLNGNVISNMMYENMYSKPKYISMLEKELSKEVEKQCMQFISKMKNNYAVDCLNLGYVAAAKYGRYTGKDWNEIVCHSEIEVKVNSKILLRGKGDFR